VEIFMRTSASVQTRIGFMTFVFRGTSFFARRLGKPISTATLVGQTFLFVHCGQTRMPA